MKKPKPQYMPEDVAFDTLLHDVEVWIADTNKRLDMYLSGLKRIKEEQDRRKGLDEKPKDGAGAYMDTRVDNQPPDNKA